MTIKEPLPSIGEVLGIDNEYEVHWISKDLAYLTQDGDIVSEFCSVNSHGFENEADVIDQAANIVAEWDAELT